MRRSIAPLVAVIVAAVIGALWWHHHHRASAPTAAAGDAHPVAFGPRHAQRPPSRPASLSGRVTKKADGTGIANAVVAAERAEQDGMRMPGEEPPPLVATTAADGSWSIAVVPPGRYTVSAAADGFLPGSQNDVALAPGEARAGIAIALAAGGTLVHGTVSDVGGGPISGAQIQLRNRGVHGRLVALTNKDGAYHITLRPGSYTLLARSDDYVEKTRFVEVATTPLTVDFTLVPGGTVRGVVVTSDTHQPVPHARVSAARGGRGRGGFNFGFDEPETTSGDDGTFALTGCPSGLVALSARGNGYTSKEPTEVRLGIGEAASGVEITVDRALSISGRVVMKETHQPLAEIAVAARAFTGGRGETEDPTGSDGTFEIDGLVPGTYMVIAGGPNAVTDMGTSVTLADKDVTGIEIALEQGVALSGRVDPPGPASIAVEPAEKVGMGNMMQFAKLAAVTATADEHGAWTLAHVPAGSWKLAAHTDAGAAGELPITVTAKQDGLVIPMTPRASIAGHVVDSDGKPVTNTEIVAMAGDAVQQFARGAARNNATTADDGSFQIVGLDGGSYSIVVGGLQDRIAAMANPANATRVDVEPGAAKTGVTVTIPAKNGVIHGHVTDANGQPVTDAWVSAEVEGSAADGPVRRTFGGMFGGGADPALTGDGGAFEVKGLAAGAYTVVVDGGKLPAHAEQHGVHTGDTVAIQLQPLGSLTGHVTSGGAPVTHYQIGCYGPSGDNRRTVASADGAYQLDNLPPGSYTCTATGDTGEVREKVDVPAGPATLDLALAGYGSITGTVVNSDGSPLVGVMVTPQDRAHFMALVTGGGAHTDASGRFHVDRVAAGSGSIAVMPSSGGMMPLGRQTYVMPAAGQIDVGTITILPQTDDGTGSGSGG